MKESRSKLRDKVSKDRKSVIRSGYVQKKKHPWRDEKEV